MTTTLPPIDSNSRHTVSAQMALDASTEATSNANPELASVYATQAVAHASLAQAHEARTASLQRYYDSLTHDGAKHHEQQHAAAVLAVICDRLGLAAS